MNKLVLPFIVASFSFLASADASLINFQSGAVTALQSDNATSLSNEVEGTFEFALGTFNESVLEGSSSGWEAGLTNQMVGNNVWKTTPPAPLQNKFQGETSMTDGIATSQQAYILGYSTINDDFIVFKNAAWVFPAFAAVDTNGADVFSLQDANTQVLQSSGSFSSFSGSFTMIAVPEPSAFAAIVGVLTLGIVVVRRRRAYV
jgi:hypothetical protein